jgi:uncharacterized membrane protein YkvA (DUF1232 family)
MKVSFELSPRDMRYFRDRLKRVRAGEGTRDEETVIRLAEELVEEAVTAEPPEFVRVRLLKLERLIEMLRDAEWRLQGRDRARILDALVYFVDPDDLIPDRVPGIGYLDDAIMVELIAQELKHDIHAYEDFCEFRKSRAQGKGGAKLETRRQTLQTRMRRRQRREQQQHRDRSGSTRSPLRLW